MLPKSERRDFFVYLDEFQTFTTFSLATMLAELRKYRVGMVVLAHQYLSQLEPEIRDAVLGSAGTLVSFRLLAADAGYVAREFAPSLTEEDHLICLPNHNVYLKLMIGGEVAKAFSAETVRRQNLGQEAIQRPVSSSALRLGARGSACGTIIKRA